MKPQSLVGTFFHSIENGQVEWQGYVIGNPEPGWYLLQLFEWVTGEPNVQRLARLDSMEFWLFYPDQESMLLSYEHGVARKNGPYRKVDDPQQPIELMSASEFCDLSERELKS